MADLEYAGDEERPPSPIRTPMGLLWVMCQDLDDTPLRERERRQARARAEEERRRRLRALEERGCKVCGFWQVLESGYCADHDPALQAFNAKLGAGTGTGAGTVN